MGGVLLCQVQLYVSAAYIDVASQGGIVVSLRPILLLTPACVQLSLARWQCQAEAAPVGVAETPHVYIRSRCTCC